MAKFVPRLTAPTASDKNWIHYSAGGYCSCIKINSNWCLPNCVGYAQGRWQELFGATKVNWKLPACNAEDWIEAAQKNGFEIGQTPKLGAVICWAKGKIKNGADGCGHVAVVEEIKSNGDIVISQSGYRKYTGEYWPNFSTHTITKASGYSGGTGYTFRGFIYPGIDFTNEVKPQTTVTPQVQPQTIEKLPIGTVVKLLPGVKWSNGKTVASFVFKTTLTVTGYSGDFHKLSTQGVKGITTGTILPQYLEVISKPEEKKTTIVEIKVGDIVQFKGSKQYTSSYPGGKEVKAQACEAKVTLLSKNQPHPYHCVGKSVYGWCNAEDVVKK